MITYPTNWPDPLQDYGQDVAPFVRRMQFDSGWVRQRRKWDSTKTIISLTFRMTTSVFSLWSDWMTTYGYNWFTINLDDYGAGREATDIRLISSFRWTYRHHDRVDVSVSAEIRNA